MGSTDYQTSIYLNGSLIWTSPYYELTLSQTAFALQIIGYDDRLFKNIHFISHRKKI